MNPQGTARRHIKILHLRICGRAGLIDRHSDAFEKRYSLREQDLQADAYMHIIQEMVEMDLDPAWADAFHWPLKTGLLGPRHIIQAKRMLWRAAGKIVPAYDYYEDYVVDQVKEYGCCFIKKIGKSGWYLDGKFVGSDRYEAYDNLMANKWPESCQCGNTKREHMPFCHQCWLSFPHGIQRGLDLDVGEGFEEAHKKAVEWLNFSYKEAYEEAIACLN